MDISEAGRATLPGDATPGDPTPGDPTRPQAVARVALAVALFGFGVWTLLNYLPALAWATVLAIAVWPVFQLAGGRWPPGKHNVLLPVVFTAAVALLFLVPLGLVVLQVGRDAHAAMAWVHQVRTTGVPLPDWVAHLPLVGAQAGAWWQDNLADPQGSAELLERLDRAQALTLSRRFGTLVAHRAVLFAFTLLTLFFLFRNGQSVIRQMLTASRKAFGPRGERIGRQMVASVRGTVDGLVLVGLGEGLLLGIAYISLGVPHPALFGALTAGAAMLPFGAALVFGIAAVTLLIQGSTTSAIILVAIGFVITFVADHAIRPVLIGSTTRLPFLWILLGILGGLETWGLLGVFLGPAIMAALILLWREWTDEPDAPKTVPV